MPGVAGRSLILFVCGIGCSGLGRSKPILSEQARCADASCALDKLATKRQLYIDSTGSGASELLSLLDFVSKNVAYAPGQYAMFSRCSVFASLLGAFFERADRDPDEFVETAMVVLADPTSVGENLQTAVSRLDDIPLSRRILSPRTWDFREGATAMWRARRELFDVRGRPNFEPGFEFLRRADGFDLSGGQALDHGYLQEDFDVSGRHDHFLSNAYLMSMVESQAWPVEWPMGIGVLLRLRGLELERERRDALKHMLPFAALVDGPPEQLQTLASIYPAAIQGNFLKHLTQFRRQAQILYDLGLVDKQIVLAVADARVLSSLPMDQQKSLKALMALERHLVSYTDLRVNHLGRSFYRLLKAGTLANGVDVERWVFSRVCDESHVKKHRLLKAYGPLISTSADEQAAIGDLPTSVGKSFLLPVLVSTSNGIGSVQSCAGILGRLPRLPLVVPAEFELDSEPQSSTASD